MYFADVVIQFKFQVQTPVGSSMFKGRQSLLPKKLFFLTYKFLLELLLNFDLEITKKSSII